MELESLWEWICELLGAAYAASLKNIAIDIKYQNFSKDDMFHNTGHPYGWPK